MLTFLFNSLLACGGLFYANQYAINTFPEYYAHAIETVVCGAGWQYSWLQIKFIKYKREFSSFLFKTTTKYPFLTQICQYFKKPVKCIEYVKHGEVVYSCTKDDYCPDSLNDYDFMIYSVGIDKIIYYQGDGDLLECNSYVYSDKKFLLVELKCKTKDTIGIKFTNEDKKYNFMVAGNGINKKFMLYFLQTYYFNEMNCVLNELNVYTFEDVHYDLTIVDDSSNIKTYTHEEKFFL